MKKEDVVTLAQLLNALQDAADKVEEAQRTKNGEMLSAAKQEILIFQKEIDKLL